MGVWIETYISKKTGKNVESHPAWVCGLKPPLVDIAVAALKVTPCVGVWIETRV